MNLTDQDLILAQDALNQTLGGTDTTYQGPNQDKVNAEITRLSNEVDAGNLNEADAKRQFSMKFQTAAQNSNDPVPAEIIAAIKAVKTPKGNPAYGLYIASDDGQILDNSDDVLSSKQNLTVYQYDVEGISVPQFGKAKFITTQLLSKAKGVYQGYREGTASGSLNVMSFVTTSCDNPEMVGQDVEILLTKNQESLISEISFLKSQNNQQLVVTFELQNVENGFTRTFRSSTGTSYIATQESISNGIRIEPISVSVIRNSQKQAERLLMIVESINQKVASAIGNGQALVASAKMTRKVNDALLEQGIDLSMLQTLGLVSGVVTGNTQHAPANRQLTDGAVEAE